LGERRQVRGGCFQHSTAKFLTGPCTSHKPALGLFTLGSSSWQVKARDERQSLLRFLKDFSEHRSREQEKDGGACKASPASEFWLFKVKLL